MSPDPVPQKETEYYDIKILRDGTWLYQGTPITRHNLVKLFSRVLKKDAAGDYWLETPHERGRITVEDAPFIATAVTVAGTGKAMTLTFHTNIDEAVVAGKNHPLRLAPDGIPYILVRDGLDARIARPVYYELASLAADNGTDGVWSQNQFYRLTAD